MRTRRIAVTGGLVAALFACGGDLAEEAGDAMKGIGKGLADAGAAIADSGDSDASAQDAAASNTSATYDVECEPVSRTVVTAVGDATVTTVTTLWFARAPAPSAGITGIDALLCERESFGSATPSFSCTGGGCTGTYEGEPQCVTATADTVGSNVRVLCGKRETTTCANSGLCDQPKANGATFHRARITIRH